MSWRPDIRRRPGDAGVSQTCCTGGLSLGIPACRFRYGQGTRRIGNSPSAYNGLRRQRPTPHRPTIDSKSPYAVGKLLLVHGGQWTTACRRTVTLRLAERLMPPTRFSYASYRARTPITSTSATSTRRQSPQMDFLVRHLPRVCNSPRDYRLTPVPNHDMGVGGGSPQPNLRLTVPRPKNSW